MVTRSRWYHPALAAITAAFLILDYATWRTFNCPWSEDVGLFSQLCYSVVTDLSFGTSIYAVSNFLAQMHFTPIYVLWAPAYYVFPTAFTLIVLSVAFTTLTIHALVRFAERQFEGRAVPVLFGLAFLCSTSVLNAYLHFFGRESVFATGFFALALLFYAEERFGLWVTTLVLASLCAEYTSLIVAGFGIAGFVHRRPGRWVALPFLFGLAYFLVVTVFVMPGLRGSGGFAGAKFSEYSYLGATPLDVAWSLVSNPDRTFAILTAAHRPAFGLAILAPVLFLPVIGIEFALIPVSQYLLFLLPRPDYYANVGWWYHLPAVPFIFTAAIVGVRRISRLTRWRWLPVTAAALVLMATVVSSARHVEAEFRTHLGYLRSMDQPLWATLGRIPPESSVSAQWVFVAGVSARKRAYIYPRLADEADYVVLGTGRWEHPFRSRAEYLDSIRQLLSQGRYGVLAHFPNGDMVLKKAYSTAENQQVLDGLPSAR